MMPDAPSNDMLCEAARRGYPRSTKRFLALGASPNATDADGDPALCLAVRGEHKEVAFALIRAGASPAAAEKEGVTALHRIAGWSGAADLFAAALERGGEDAVHATDSWGLSVVHGAAESGDIAVLQRLLELGANPSARDTFGVSPLLLAINRKRLAAVDALLSAGAEFSGGVDGARKLPPLHEAVTGGSVSIVKSLLRAGADPTQHDSYGATPLHCAARSCARDSDLPEIIEALCAAGADANARDTLGRTPLLALNGMHPDPEWIESLLMQGADPDASYGKGQNSPLLLAVELRLFAIVEKLASAVRDVDRVDATGRTALQRLAELSSPAPLSTVQALLDAGASPEAADDGRPTPLELMRQSLAGEDASSCYALRLAAIVSDMEAHCADATNATLNDTRPSP